MTSSELPRFPDITPDTLRKSLIHEFQDEDIQTEADMKTLLKLMYDYPERDFYFFFRKGEGIKSRVSSAIQAGSIIQGEMEFHYYPHPNFRNDFVKIRENEIEFDWEKDVLAKGPMYIRCVLKLSERARKDFEHAELIQKLTEGTAGSATQLWGLRHLVTSYQKNAPLWNTVGILATVLGLALAAIAL